MKKMFINYRPTAMQARFHASKSRFKLLRAGRRAGKTTAAVNEFIRNVCKRKGHYWVVGPNYPILRTAERLFRHFLPREVLREHSKTEKSYRLVNGSLIEFRSADNPDSLVSVGLDGLLIDEAARVSRAAWEENLRATLTDRRGWAIFATTPKGRANWIYDLHRDYPGVYGDDFAEFVFRTVDNTAVPGLSQEVELARRSLPERYFRQDFEGSFEAFTGAVYPEFDEALHVISVGQAPSPVSVGQAGRVGAAPVYNRVIAGVDWGYTHPAAIIVVGQIVGGDPCVAPGQTRGSAPTLFVLDEFYEKGLLVEETGLVGRARALKERWGIELFVADPSEPAYIEKFRRCGLPCKLGDNDVGPGIQAVAMALHHPTGGGIQGSSGSPATHLPGHLGPGPSPGTGDGACPTDKNVGTGLGRAGKVRSPGMLISARCVNLIRELKLYHWKELKTTGEVTEEPDKVDDHACDALRYAVMELMRPKAISIGRDPEDEGFARGRRWRQG